nr:MAPEG family protein [Sphingomonas liriopis]
MRGMAIGMVVTIAAVVVGLARSHAATLEARLTTFGIAALVLGLWIAVSVGSVARARFLSAAAIGGGDGVDPRVDAANAVLRNTIEQALLAGFAYAALVLVDDHAREPVALFVACFSAGRLLFWSGYRDGAAARSLGFALTFYPSVAALLVAGFALIP